MRRPRGHSRRSNVTRLSCFASILLVGGTLVPSAAGVHQADAAPTTQHPRLMIKASQLGALRARAVASNKVWATLSATAVTARQQMDDGAVPKEDLGSYVYETYPTELYAELFAFMGLVEPDPKARTDWGRRARTLLMYVIDRAKPGVGAEDTPFRAPLFSTGDRSRYYGEAYGLTLDWAYSSFSSADKTKIREVYSRWADEQYRGYPLNQLDAGTTPDLRKPSAAPALIANRYAVRWSINNYSLAHARNLGLMAMAFDPVDDPGNVLRRHIPTLSGQWLFTLDKMLRTDAAGGLSPEGFEYGSDALGRTAQLMLAMQTAGEAGGPVSRFETNPFWSDSLTAILSSLPWSTAATAADSGLGRVYQPAWFGDGESYWAVDPIALVAPLGLAAAERGDTRTLNAARWMAESVGAGGPELLEYRVGSNNFFGGILYFLLLDPATRPTDPRPKLPNTWFAPGISRILARTCWCKDERLFTYMLAWSAIDHQRGDGNDFGLLRKGEWLTKNRVGYSNPFTDHHNTMAVQNDPFVGEADDYRTIGSASGSQWGLDPSGDPTLLAWERRAGYTYALGDATKLYNSPSEGPVGIGHVSRSIVWLEPDVVVTYDRAVTAKAGRFKRTWLQLPASPKVTGQRAVVDTPRGQRVFVTALEPANATLRPVRRGAEDGTPAVGEPMTDALGIEATGNPTSTQILTVVEGADGGASPTPTQRTQARGSGGATFVGAVVGPTAVLFPISIGNKVQSFRADVPSTVTRVLITGLTPGGRYTVDRRGGAVSVEVGGTTTATQAGIIDLR